MGFHVGREGRSERAICENLKLDDMSDFMVIEVKSIWVRLSGRIWRFKYNLKAKIRRVKGQFTYNQNKQRMKPRIYRVVIR